jgi:hypothetical protein
MQNINISIEKNGTKVKVRVLGKFYVKICIKYVYRIEWIAL